jgi:hypothetical protein
VPVHRFSRSALASFFLPSPIELYGNVVSVIAWLFLDRRKTTIDLGASRYFLCSSWTPWFEKSSGLGKAVSAIFVHRLCQSLLHMELQVFPIGVDHHLDVVTTLRSAVPAECQAVRVVGSIVATIFYKCFLSLWGSMLPAR